MRKRIALRGSFCSLYFLGGWPPTSCLTGKTIKVELLPPLLANVVVVNGLTDHISEFFDRFLVAGKRMAFGVVKEVCRVSVTDIVQRHGAVKVRIQRADCSVSRAFSHRSRETKETH
jgi:hypothetical protein